jgi:hypothetical protein
MVLADRAAARSSRWTLLGFILSIVIPSTGVVWKYLGYPGIVAYAAAASLLIIMGRRALFDRLSRWLAGRDLWVAAVSFVLLCGLVVAVYPLANSGAIGGGSDRDDMVNVAAGDLLRGNYPYYRTTYLGNPISLLPGALILATPFVLLGIGAYQNLFWLIVFFLTLRACLKEHSRALLLIWLALALSPIALNELVTGSDLLTNTLYVFVFLVWLVIAVSRSDRPWWIRLAAAILLGIGLSSRANFVFLLPLAFAVMARTAGWRPALLYTGATCLALGVVTLPFYLYDPSRFTPLTTQDKFVQFEALLPNLWLIVPGATALLALGLALRAGSFDLWDLLQRCTVVLAFPVLCAILLGSVSAGKPDFRFAFYGVAFLFFGAAGFWQGTTAQPDAAPTLTAPARRHPAPGTIPARRS